MNPRDITNLAKFSEGAMQVNIFEAKTDLSKLINLLETKEEESITIARRGKPVAKLVPYEKKNRYIIGVAEGDPDLDISLEELNSMNDEILKMFGIE